MLEELKFNPYPYGCRQKLMLSTTKGKRTVSLQCYHINHQEYEQIADLELRRTFASRNSCNYMTAFLERIPR